MLYREARICNPSFEGLLSASGPCAGRPVSVGGNPCVGRPGDTGFLHALIPLRQVGTTRPCLQGWLQTSRDIPFRPLPGRELTLSHIDNNNSNPTIAIRC